jgi:hypothetical protein
MITVRSAETINNNNNNVIQKEAEKKLKYKNLSIEIQRMWNMKCFVMSVIIGATGIVSKSLQKYLETIPGQHSIVSLQKSCHTRNITVGFTTGSRGKVPGKKENL